MRPLSQQKNLHRAPPPSVLPGDDRVACATPLLVLRRQDRKESWFRDEITARPFWLWRQDADPNLIFPLGIGQARGRPEFKFVVT